MKRFVVGIVSVVVLLAAAATQDNNPQAVSPVASQSAASTAKKTPPICDGATITSNCIAEGVHYRTYIYHAAVPEKSHTETVTTYREEVSGYCTLCVDGTYSPSCATGRGACSWHGGVAQWNAPVYRTVPVYNVKTIIDIPAQEAYYEKVVE